MHGAAVWAFWLICLFAELPIGGVYEFDPYCAVGYYIFALTAQEATAVLHQKESTANAMLACALQLSSYSSCSICSGQSSIQVTFSAAGFRCPFRGIGS